MTIQEFRSNKNEDIRHFLRNEQIIVEHRLRNAFGT